MQQLLLRLGSKQLIQKNLPSFIQPSKSLMFLISQPVSPLPFTSVCQDTENFGRTDQGNLKEMTWEEKNSTTFKAMDEVEE